MKRAGTRALAAAFVATSALGSSAVIGAAPAHADTTYICSYGVSSQPLLAYGYVYGSGWAACNYPTQVYDHVSLWARKHGSTTWSVVDDNLYSGWNPPQELAVAIPCRSGTYDYRLTQEATAGSLSGSHASNISTFSCK